MPGMYVCDVIPANSRRREPAATPLAPKQRYFMQINNLHA